MWEGKVLKKIEFEIELIKLARRPTKEFKMALETKMRLKSSFSRKEQNAFFDNFIDANDQTVNILSQITMEAMHALLLRFTGRTIRTIQGLIMSKKLQDIVSELYDQLSLRAKTASEDRILSAISSACPLIKSSNNCKTLTGRMKANNVEDYLNVMCIIYSIIFNDEFGRIIDEEGLYSSFFSKCVTTSDSFKNGNMTELFQAIRTYVRCNVNIVHLMRSSAVSEADLVEIEDNFIQIEQAAIMIDHVLPFKKKNPFETTMNDEELFAVDNDELSSDESGTSSADEADHELPQMENRMHINEYPTYKFTREHYAYFIRKYGSPKYSEATLGEHGCLVLRENSRLTNHIDMSPQLLDKINTNMTFLALLHGVPYCMYEGVLLRRLKLSAEMRLKYFVESAKHHQLIVPGEKLQELFAIKTNDEDADDENDLDVDALDGRKKDVANAIMAALSPKLISSVNGSAPHGASPVRSKGNRWKIFNLNDITNMWFSKQRQLELLNRRNTRNPDESCPSENELLKTFLSKLGCSDMSKHQQTSLQLVEYRKIVTSCGSICTDKPSYARHVRIQGEDDEGNMEYWFGKVLAVYSMVTHTNGQLDVHRDQLAIIVLYYKPTGDTDPVFDYPVYQADSIDCIKADEMITFAHLFRPEGILNVINKRSGMFPLPELGPRYNRILTNDALLLNKHAKFPRFW